MYANFCFGTPVLFMRAWACVALSGWRVKNYCTRIIQGSLWVPWFTGKESPERKNNSPVHPATNLKIAVDAVRETGETWVESEKNVEKKGLVQ